MIRALREGTWLTPARLRAYGLGYLLVVLAAVAATVPLILGWREAPPADLDYLSFHAAATMADAGRAAEVWDRDAHAAAQSALQGQPGRYFSFFYPPLFLLVLMPLGLLPLLLGLGVWLAATGGAMWVALRPWGVFRRPIAAACVMLAPAAVLNALHGQNGFLATALLAGAGLWLDRHPARAGAMFAMLAFKPQLGLLVLPVLLAGRRWAALGWAAGLGLASVALATLVLGPGIWPAFLARMPDAGAALSDGALAVWKLQSVMAMALTLGLPRGAAMGAQAIVAAAVLAAAIVAARRHLGGRAELAVIAAGAPLATPFVLVYDLVVLLVPMVWLLGEARRSGFLPWEKSGIALAWILPLLAFLASIGAEVSIGPLASIVTLGLVLRRIAAAPSARDQRPVA
ncbi:DUF2029 domain-containing protein [Roseomonas sp. JC162]|uniref:DUF2029 domain-containing protein n=1 Tax=Neoroseomonas marina TaxID=1232220 RepID=A0A848EDS7_9PROT|nr:glycosyltransferase family 87 protein [Neoroseomonas marina]NMJ42651.1 DUF2029 domain-containing protein [Neoroseomonas marina]